MSNLLNSNSAVPIFREPTGAKYGFIEEYTDALINMFWKWDSVPLGKDKNDYENDKVNNPKDARLIEEIMKLFTSSEVLVKNGYAKFASIFKPNEVINWCMYAGGSEVIHEKAYSLFTETIGLPDSTYTEFLDVNIMKAKTKFIDKAKVRKWEDYKAMGMTDAEADYEFRRSVARMLAIYGAGTEAITLYAQFAMLLNFQTKGKYPGLCQIVEYSIRDEFTHHLGNASIFRAYIKENPEIWDDALKFDIYEAIREIVSYEESLIDYLNPDDKDMYKNYVKYQADRALEALSMKTNYGIKKNPCKFMEEVTGTVLTDFFSGKVTSYSRKMLGSRDELRKKLSES